MEHKTKVVHLITLLELGGAQGNTLHTVRTLDKNKYVTELWCGKGAYWDKETNEARYFSHLVRPIHPLYDLLIIFDLWRALKRSKPDILHTHSSKAGIVGRLAGFLAGVPIIIHTFHGFGFNNHQKLPVKWLFILLERWMAKLSTRLIFVSRSNIETAVSLGIGKEPQYVLIRSGVPIHAIQEAAQNTNEQTLRNELNIPHESPLITTIGPFKPQKNLSGFLEVAKLVLEKLPTTHFLIIGDGVQRSQLEQKARELKLENHIHMPGWRRDIPSLLKISQLFVLTSLWEGLPRSLVEAMIVGIPSICYDTDGVHDLLSKGGGRIVLPHDTGTMASSIISLLNNPTAYAQSSKEAKQMISKEFDIDWMVIQQAYLYASLDKPRRIN